MISLSSNRDSFAEGLADKALAGEQISRKEASVVLGTHADDLLPLLSAAYRVRNKAFGNKVHIHVLENAKLGACPEDCSFCSQSAHYQSPSGVAPLEAITELVEAAKKAAAMGAKRFCMVTATRAPSSKDLDVICQATESIKANANIEVCTSLGLLTEKKAQRLADAGVDRFNHNLETGPDHFKNVVSTHTFQDRVDTVGHARRAGMDICSGGIVGLGESEGDLLDLMYELAALKVDSLPVNFLDPRPGTPMAERGGVDPKYALAVLCLARFLHPVADIRVAGGRETTLRSMQGLALYPANSIFTNGYLTTDGNRPSFDHQMILDMGFEIDRGEKKQSQNEAEMATQVAAV